jgi:hypothetical protein
VTGPVGRLVAFLALGIVTGGIVGAVLSDDHAINSFTLYVLPGLVFGLAFGPMLAWCRATGPRGAAIYAVAAVGAHAVAVLAAINLVDPVEKLFGAEELWALVAVGIVAGAIGGGLLGGVTALVATARRWPWLGLAGALLGAFLPLFLQWAGTGAFVFFVLWQAGYGGALALILPGLEEA